MSNEIEFIDELPFDLAEEKAMSDSRKIDAGEINTEDGAYDVGVYRLAHHHSRWADKWEGINELNIGRRARRPALVVLGLDVSLTSTGATILESPTGDHLSVAIKPRGETLQRRLRSHRDQLYALLRGWEPLPLVALVERGFTGGTGPTATVLGQVQGVYIQALDDLLIETHFIAPTTLKKFATGFGNAEKEEVLEAAITQLGFQTSGDLKRDRKTDYDRADSLWCAHAAGFIVGERFQTNVDYHYEQIQALEKLDEMEEAE